jgi:hypothetical protein
MYEKMVFLISLISNFLSIILDQLGISRKLVARRGVSFVSFAGVIFGVYKFQNIVAWVFSKSPHGIYLYYVVIFISFVLFLLFFISISALWIFNGLFIGCINPISNKIVIHLRYFKLYAPVKLVRDFRESFSFWMDMGGSSVYIRAHFLDRTDESLLKLGALLAGDYLDVLNIRVGRIDNVITQISHWLLVCKKIPLFGKSDGFIKFSKKY